MTLKLLRHTTGLSLALLMAGSALSATAHVVSAFDAPAIEQESDAVSPNPAHDPQYVLANLTEVSPFNLSFVIADEWKKGNRLRASFWYYIWQIRTDAWVTGVDEVGFSFYRNSMSDEMGRTINTWIMADPALMRDTAQRAIAYEARLPLSNMRPDEMNEADWLAIITKARSDYAAEFREVFAEMSDEDIRTARQQNGLPVGTPVDIGAPLDEDWR